MAMAADERTAVVAFLSSSTAMAGLPEPVLEVVAENLRVETFAPGESLIEQGATGDSVMILAEGNAQVSVRDDDGIATVLAMTGPGTVLGEMALLTQEPRSADVIAVADVRALVLDADDFRRLVAEHPEIAVVLTYLIADRLGHARKDGLRDKVLGGYRIKQRLGRGATAVVYRAERVTDDETVALKMLSHRLAFDDIAIARFHRELDIVERLRHPNVARVHGRFEGFATYFLAMEFVKGQDLDDVLNEYGGLASDMVRALVGQVAAALSHVHQHGVVHKDLKPANVMLHENGTAKLMDFGIAEPPPSERAALQGRQLFTGTPLYMAPEQFREPEVGPTVDVYALGCLTFELLTGTAPFAAEGLGALVMQKSRGETLDLAALCPNVDPDLLEVVNTSLLPNAADRTLDLDAITSWGSPVVFG